MIAPVGRFGYRGRDYALGTGEPGPVARKLLKSLTDIQYGRAPDPYDWTRVVKIASVTTATSVTSA